MDEFYEIHKQIAYMDELTSEIRATIEKLKKQINEIQGEKEHEKE